MQNGWVKFPVDPDDFTRAVCSVAAAIIGAGALGAGATMWGASKAAGAQTAAQNQNIDLQKMVQLRNQNLLSPYIQAGWDTLPKLNDWLNPNNTGGPLNALMRLTMPGANMTDALKQTPGFQFTEDRGLRAVNNALAARGLGGSGGAVAKGASEYTTGLASNTWQSVVNALQSLWGGGASALQNLVGTGANASGNLAGGGIATATNIGNALTGIGNAQGGAATATGNAIGGLGNSVSTAAILQKLLGNAGGGGGAAGLYDTTGWNGGAWNVGNAAVTG